MTKLSDADLVEIRRRVNDTTQGSWDVVDGDTVRAIDATRNKAVPILYSVAPIEYHKNKGVTQDVMFRAENEKAANARFAAAAHSDVLALLNHIVEMRQEYDRLRLQYGAVRKAVVEVRAKVHGNGQKISGPFRKELRDVCDEALEIGKPLAMRAS